MNSLTQRLSLLRKQSGNQLVAASSLVANNSKSTSLADQLAFRQTTRHASSKKLTCEDIAKIVDGQVLRSGLIYISSTFDLSNLHSRYNATLIKPTKYIDSNLKFENCLFIDTETTGLSSASGTLVFLLGVATVKNNILHLEQLLLTRLNAEKYLLEWFNDKCADKTHFVSYNGKSFDIPLLENRFRMNKIRSNFCHSHVDLLHWVRRLYKTDYASHGMQDCRLTSAERYCLHFTRENDLPGSEAPSVWQELIRFGRYSRLKLLVQHHAWDIISLAGLLHHIENSLASEKNEVLNHFSSANYFIQNNNNKIGRRILTSNYATLTPSALFLLSKLYRKEKKWAEAIKIWQKLSSIPYLPAIESLAKFHEHQDRNLDKALFYTQLLIENDSNLDHHKRLSRIKRKKMIPQNQALNSISKKIDKDPNLCRKVFPV